MPNSWLFLLQANFMPRLKSNGQALPSNTAGILQFINSPSSQESLAANLEAITSDPCASSVLKKNMGMLLFVFQRDTQTEKTETDLRKLHKSIRKMSQSVKDQGWNVNGLCQFKVTYECLCNIGTSVNYTSSTVTACWVSALCVCKLVSVTTPESIKWINFNWVEILIMILQ